jgi:hypothetical protein
VPRALKGAPGCDAAAMGRCHAPRRRWVELRHSFIGEVFKTTSTRMSELQSKNKVAKLAGQVGGGRRHLGAGA